MKRQSCTWVLLMFMDSIVQIIHETLVCLSIALSLSLWQIIVGYLGWGAETTKCLEVWRGRESLMLFSPW